MDTDNVTQEEELEINFPSQEQTPTSTEQRKPKPGTRLLYGGIPADPEELGLQIYAHDPKKYANYDKIMIGKEIKTGNLNLLFTNRNYMHKEEKIKRHLEAGSLEVNGRLIVGRHKLKGVRNEYAEIMQSSSKTAK